MPTISTLGTALSDVSCHWKWWVNPSSPAMHQGTDCTLDLSNYIPHQQHPPCRNSNKECLCTPRAPARRAIPEGRKSKRAQVMHASVLTFRESKQAITRPFSTWQLRDGWANLHSASDREQVPLWNSRHTSNVSHFVSRTRETFTAIVKTKSDQASEGTLPGGTRYCWAAWVSSCLFKKRVKKWIQVKREEITNLLLW